MPDYWFTDEQKRVVGELLCEHWGANIQTGFGINHIPYVYIQMGPNLPIEGWHIWPEGLVTSIDEQEVEDGNQDEG